MRKMILLLSAVMVSAIVFGQGIEFSKKTYAEALKQAKKENKAIFIDVYTSWCGPCKYMSENTFTIPAVGAEYNKNFICLKLDAEKSEDGRAVAKKFDVSAYPTLLFVNGDGELVYRFLGGRDEAGMLNESKLALTAFKAMPELKRLEKKYAKGDRSKSFLNQYYIARSGAGLDCGEVLMHYFNLLSDEEVIDTTNLKRVGGISAYDAKLLKRLVDLDVKISNDSSMDKKLVSEYNKQVGKALGGVLGNSARNDREAEFESVMDLRALYFNIKGNAPSVTSASLGGGSLFMPTETIRLDYYSGKKKDDKFISTVESYMAKLMEEGVEKQAKMKEMNAAFDAEVAAAEKAKDKEKLSTLKKTRGMMNIFTVMDDFYIYSTMIEHTGKYYDMYKGAKDAAFTDKIVEWYNFLSEMHVSCKSAPGAAEKLAEIGKKQEAKKILINALVDGQKATGVEPADIEKCKELLLNI